jgi:hypothetical protein
MPDYEPAHVGTEGESRAVTNVHARLSKDSIITKLDKPGVVLLHGSQVKFDNSLKFD